MKRKRVEFSDRKESKEIIRQFEIAMALMSVIPLLGFVYLVGRISGLSYFAEPGGIVTLFIIAVALSGMLLARFLVSNVVGRLGRANDELRKASEMKSSFLRNVAHEAATPLATTRNHLEAMKDELYGPAGPEMQKSIGVSLRQVTRLTRIIHDLLDTGRIEAGTLHMEFEPTDLSLLLKEAMETASEGLPARRDRIRLLAELQPRWVESADRDRIVQTVVNLLRNAEKYSPENPEIELDVQDRGSQYEISVADHGDGIPDEAKEIIFEPFTRHTSRKVGGLGLGLAISRHIAHAHGGRLWVEDNEGSGSVFKFTVPKQRSQENSDQNVFPAFPPSNRND